ncbi:MAG: hydroxymethylglutaryl-CoA lyase, partial [Paracoccaceae bacterium]|nr:hydroxymethylglutaryl-CoA lyase [Paracoccaceae bacterium]
LGCYEVSLGDTTGQAHPEAIRAMLRAVLEELPPERLAGHFHDTAGRALANIEASLSMGLRVFDASVGGLGGCPYAPGAAGNVATEAVAAYLASLRYQTGLDAQVLAQAADMARDLRRG